MAKQQGRVFFCTPQGRGPGSSSPAPCLPTPWDESLSRPQSPHSSGLSSLRRSRCWLVPITSHIRTADRFRLRSLRPFFSVSWFVPNSAFLVQVEKRVLPCCQPGVTRQGGSVRRGSEAEGACAGCDRDFRAVTSTCSASTAPEEDGSLIIASSGKGVPLTSTSLRAT